MGEWVGESGRRRATETERDRESVCVYVSERERERLRATNIMRVFGKSLFQKPFGTKSFFFQYLRVFAHVRVFAQ